MRESKIYEQASAEAVNPLFERIRYVRGPATAVYHLIGAITLGEVYNVAPEVAEAALATEQFEKAD